MQREQRTLKFKWCLSRHVQILFFLPLQPPPPERGNKSRGFFARSWSHGWAGGQTSITDENMRLSGGPLKEDCWGGPETSMSCLWARACVHWRTERRRRRRRRQVMLHYRWWHCVSTSRPKCWYISVIHPPQIPTRAQSHTIYALVLQSGTGKPLWHGPSSFLITFHFSVHVFRLCQHVMSSNEWTQWEIYAENAVWPNFSVSAHPLSQK